MSLLGSTYQSVGTWAVADLLQHPGIAVRVGEVGEAGAVAAFRVGARLPVAPLSARPAAGRLAIIVTLRLTGHMACLLGALINPGRCRFGPESS